jgi:hypothetical protein
MRFKFEIIICIFFSLSLTLFSQENKSFNFKTNSMWLLEDYYNGLIQDQSPQKLYELVDSQIITIEFSNKENKFRFSNFREPFTFSYSVLNNNKIKIINNDPDPFFDVSKWLIDCTITFEEINGTTKLIFENKDEKKIFLRLNDRYRTINDIDKFINDCLIAGNYVSSDDSTLKVSFAADGTLSGLGNFNHYLISITSDEVPKTFNTISFNELKKTKSGTKVTNVNYFYWEKKDNRLVLYRTTEQTPDAKIQGKYIELIKTGS